MTIENKTDNKYLDILIKDAFDGMPYDDPYITVKDYDFDKDKEYGYANCLIGFSNDVENSVLTVLNSKWEYGYKAKYREITKEMIGH